MARHPAARRLGDLVQEKRIPMNTAPRPSSDDFARGLAGIVAGRTAICSLEGDLRYRGYAIEPLARAGDFEEVAFLLLHGELPTRLERDAFAARVSAAPGDNHREIATPCTSARQCSIRQC